MDNHISRDFSVLVDFHPVIVKPSIECKTITQFRCRQHTNIITIVNDAIFIYATVNNVPLKFAYIPHKFSSFVK